MPNIQNLTTQELLDQIAAGPLTSPQSQALTEITGSRIIKQGDDDDIVNGGVETTRGGVRPHHAPLVP